MIDVITTHDGLRSLTPTANFAITIDNDNGGIEEIIWYSDDTPQPTQSEIDAEVTRLQAEYDANQYQRDRELAYPSLQDQADMQFHDLANGTTTWQDAIQAVKDAYPKPV